MPAIAVFTHMSRKKRRFEELEANASKREEKISYRDPFQQKVGDRLEQMGSRFEGQGRNILYAVAALAVVGLLIGIFYLWNSRSNAAGQLALGRAIETSQAIVSPSPQPAGSTAKSFKTERERSEAAIAEFQAVAEKYGGAVGEKARYFIAVNRLKIDRPAGIEELRALSSSDSPAGKLSKFALAQALADDGKFDEAIPMFQALAEMDDPIIAKDTIKFDLAKAYEKQGNKQQAADLYFEIAKAASEAKDQDGNAVTMTQTASDAKEKNDELDPERAKQIVEPPPSNPFGG
jgi:tetratricopeptide (TPR) repeat protein